MQRHASARSIYPDEFDNFVERMAKASNEKIKKFKFDLNVMKGMLDVLLDINLGSEVSRARCSSSHHTAIKSHQH